MAENPAMPDEDVQLTHKPCLQRVGEWVLKEAGVKDCQVEPFLTTSPEPPWSSHPGLVQIAVDLPTTTRLSDPSDKRRQVAERAMAALPAPDCTIWSEGSAAGGTTNGGGGAVVILDHEERTIECLAVAGASCSSTRAELVAVRTALKAVAGLPPPSAANIQEIRLCTDSKACLQTLQRGPTAQPEALAADIWATLNSLTDKGKNITLQWVPGHAGIQGNEDADMLANRAAAELDQDAIPLNMASERAAIRRKIAKWTAARVRPHLPPTPNHDDLTRWEQTTLSQLRVGKSILTRKILHEIGLATNLDCKECGEEDSVRHLLTECPAYTNARARLSGGPLPSLECVLGESAHKIFQFLRRVGRVDPPVEAATADVAPATSA